MEDLISVIVPVYNTEPYLERCMDSIVNQTYKNLEIILVNDGSEDKSGEICDRYEGEDERIKVIHRRNGGAGAARNRGLEAAGGSYVCFVDSDDYIALDMYEELLSGMEEGVDIVTCGTAIISDNCSVSKDIYGYSPNPCLLKGNEAVTELVRLNKLSFSPCDKLFRRSLIDNEFFPEGRECEDLPFCYKAVKNARAILNIGKIKYFYRNRKDSTSRKEFHNRRLDYVFFSRDIFVDIQKNYPEIKSDALIMYIRSITAMMCQMKQSRLMDINADCKYIRLKKALRRMFLLILFNKKADRELKEQVISLLH